MSGSNAAVDVKVPATFIDAARKKAEARALKSKLEDGKPVEFFTYYLYTPQQPATVITDMDLALDKQP